MLHQAAAAHRSIELFGANSKRLMAGPVAPAAARISLSGMKRILTYEPRDLTVSVEAGIPYNELSRELARHGQMIPLAGPYSAEATIGGIVAANISESRRRGCGTARDLVIGMEFATLEGKLVRSGGMVVKNVAGLDMGKLMIGSFGTLAAIATVNFKLLPIPTVSRTMLFQFEDLKTTVTAFQAVMKAGLNPLAADILNPILTAQFNALFNTKGFLLALQFGGNQAVIERSTLEATLLCGGSGSPRALQYEDEQRFWTGVASVTPRHLEKFQEGAVARISTPISECGEALGTVDGAGHAMAATGIVRAWFSRPDAASRWLAASANRGLKGVIEFAGASVNKDASRGGVVLWPSPGGDFEIMKGVKKMFDPEGLLNSGRLYGLL
jgi:glycolate oxidase FAD binding subunit